MVISTSKLSIHHTPAIYSSVVHGKTALFAVLLVMANSPPVLLVKTIVKQDLNKNAPFVSCNTTKSTCSNVAKQPFALNVIYKFKTPKIGTHPVHFVTMKRWM